MAPAVKRLLPPDSSSGAASSMRTDAPASRAARLAQNAALPPPTTMTSHSFMDSTAGPRRPPMRFRPAARIAHEGLYVVQFLAVEFFASLGLGQHIPPGRQRMMRNTQIGQQLQPFGKDVVIEDDEGVIAFHPGLAQRIDEIHLAAAVGRHVLDQKHAAPVLDLAFDLGIAAETLGLLADILHRQS